MHAAFAASVLVLLSAPAPAAQGTPAGAGVPRVTSSVDRTAMWIGDRVAFAVEIVCPPGTDVLLEDLAREKLRVNGLDIVSSDAELVADASGRTVHRLRYVLTTYRTDVPSLSIEPTSVRYYARRPGERLQDIAPAGDVRVPGAQIAFRSTLPEAPAEPAIRTGAHDAVREVVFARAAELGTGLIVLALAPGAALAVSAFGRRTAGRRTRPSARLAKEDRRTTIERLRSLDVATEAGRRRAYDEISAAVRAHVEARAGVPASALTAPEIDAALAARGSRVPRQDVAALLAACDAARYGPPSALPGPDACRDAAASAERVVAGP